MIYVLLLFTAAVTLALVARHSHSNRKLIDLLSICISIIATVYAVSISSWFLLSVLPVVGLGVAIVNDYFGIAARPETAFYSERRWLSMALLLIILISWAGYKLSIGLNAVLYYAAWIILVVSIFWQIVLTVHLRRYKLTIDKRLKLDELSNLPTVSVLVPARNESHALNDTISKLLKSTYPKLEVLILDDCSHDKTPEIIRSFAHDGARFIEGKPTPEGWLGRNWALQQLTEAANGELLIFADTDVKFSSDTVADVVGVMQRDQLDMASFVPVQTPANLLGWLLPTLTNFWLSIIPFQLLNARAAIGRSFAIRSEQLSSHKFDKYKSNIYPVYKLSKHLMRSGIRYKFFFGKEIGLTIQQHYHSMARALQRSLSPAINNRIDLTLVVVTLALFALVVPIISLLTSFAWLGVVALASITLMFMRVALASGTGVQTLLSLLWPFQVIHELLQLIISGVYYRFTDLQWKDRRVCMPLLLTHNKLPEI